MLMRALLLVVGRSLQQHRLASWITAFSIALASALMLTVSSVQYQAARVFAGQAGGFDAVLGARGSPLQLVLASLYHLEMAPGNVAWSRYIAFKEDPQVAVAVPLALGDNYQGFRIVGTTPEFFSAWGKGLRFAQGRVLASGREAVIGSRVAQKTGLTLGSRFHPSHGLQAEGGEQHEEEYEVVGILAVTNSPQDRALWIPLEGVYRMSGHVLRGTGQDYSPQPGRAIPDEHKEVSAVLLKFKSPQIGMQFEQSINRRGQENTLAWPVGRVIYELFDRLRWLTQLLQITTFLVLLVASASVTASLCNTLHERRREFAILRALGAGRGFVSGVMLLESCLLSLLGTFMGFGVYYLLMLFLTRWLQNQTGIQFEIGCWHPGLWLTPMVVLAMGVGAGLLPSWLVYRGSLAPSLSQSA